MRRLPLPAACTAALILALGAQARADLTVDVGGTTIAAGGTGSVDVTISDAGDNVAVTNFQFFITPNAGATAGLSFVNPQSDSELVNPGYIFFGNSFDEISGTPVGKVSTTTNANDTFSGGDNSNDLSGVSIGATPVLIVTLDLTATLLAAGTFTISVSSNPNETFFEDGNLDTIPIAALNSGTVTVTPASVPEPASLALLGLGGAGLVIGRRRRTRRPARRRG